MLFFVRRVCGAEYFSACLLRTPHTHARARAHTHTQTHTPNKELLRRLHLRRFYHNNTLLYCILSF
jgi:hypothetical protein